jgi:hypothetical protein
MRRSGDELAGLSVDDEHSRLNAPSQCEQCGSSRVIYDHERAEIICEQCGLVLDLGAQKTPAVRLLGLRPVVPRQLLLDWCRLKRLADDEHARVDARYAPDLRRLAHAISGIPGLSCRRCGAPIMRRGERGRFPWYCKPCRMKVNSEFVKRYRKNHPQRYSRDRRKSRKPNPQASERELGGKPLGHREMRDLGLSLIPPDL